MVACLYYGESTVRIKMVAWSILWRVNSEDKDGGLSILWRVNSEDKDGGLVYTMASQQ